MGGVGCGGISGAVTTGEGTGSILMVGSGKVGGGEGWTTIGSGGAGGSVSGAGSGAAKMVVSGRVGSGTGTGSGCGSGVGEI